MPTKNNTSIIATTTKNDSPAIGVVTVEVGNNANNLPLDQNPAAVYLASLRESGKRSMHHYLNVVAAKLSNNKCDAISFPWWLLRYQHTSAVRAWLQSDFKVATANTMLIALRRVLLESWRLGLMEAEDYRRASDIHAIKGETLPRGRALKGGEMAALVRVCAEDNSPIGIRDAALIAVLYGAGLRRSEIVKLELTDYEADERSVKVRGGKGGKDRLCYIEQGAVTYLTDWLNIRGDDPGALFQPLNKGQKIERRYMNPQAVLAILRKRGKQAGLKSFSPHDLRRSFISDLLDAGNDIATVQKLAGHANIQTTARYDRRGEATKKRAADTLHVPYLK